MKHSGDKFLVRVLILALVICVLGCEGGGSIVSLPPTYLVTGTVTTSLNAGRSAQQETTVAVENAIVTLINNGNSSGTKQTQTDATGFFSFEEIVAGTYTLTIRNGPNTTLRVLYSDRIIIVPGNEALGTIMVTRAIFCGDGTKQENEGCDDGINNTDIACVADYGASCTYCTMSCVSVIVAGPMCGDGTMNGSETCDPPDTSLACTYGQTSCMKCSSSCQSVAGTVSYCGDGVLNGSESCDDGADNGDLNKCNIQCAGITSPICGNSAIEGGEQCDDGNATTEVCPYGQTSCTICDYSCQSVAGATWYCSDGATNGSETCDPPNDSLACTYGQTSCTVCDFTCQSIAGTASYCGDNALDSGAGEECDEGDAVTEACSYGQTSCLVCGSLCTFVDGASTSYCGDGVEDTSNSEQCDQGGSNTDTPCTAAYGSSCTYCSTSCVDQTVQGASCGDGVKNGTEECDDGASNGQPNRCNLFCTDTTMPVCNNDVIEAGEQCEPVDASMDCNYGSSTPCTKCNPACQNANGILHYCGDSVTDSGGGEQCDPPDVSMECAYGPTSCIKCDNSCRSIESTPHYCGDGIIDLEDGEQCDDGNTSDDDSCLSSCQENHQLYRLSSSMGICTVNCSNNRSISDCYDDTSIMRYREVLLVHVDGKTRVTVEGTLKSQANSCWRSGRAVIQLTRDGGEVVTTQDVNVFCTAYTIVTTDFYREFSNETAPFTGNLSMKMYVSDWCTWVSAGVVVNGY